MPQQIQVSAAHEANAAAAQTDGAVPQIVRLPVGPARNPSLIEQSLCDHAVRAAGKPAVQTTKGQSEPGPLLRRQIVRRPATSAACHGAQQTECGFHTRADAVIERKHDGGWSSGVSSIDQHDRQSRASVFDEPMLAVSSAKREARRQRPNGASFWEIRRGRRDNYCGGIEARQPHDAGMVCAQARIGREIATPSAGRVGWRIPGLPRLRQLQIDRSADSRNCVAEIPTRTPWSRSHRETCRFLRTASHILGASVQFPLRCISDASILCTKLQTNY